MNQPLVVDKKNVIIVGHTRYRALIELGVERVPVIVAKHLSQQKAREYRIADNKSGEIAEWNRDALIPELRQTDLANMGLFFAEADLAKMLSEANGSVFKPVSAEVMDRALDKHNGRISNLVGRSPVGAQIRLECPHCGEGFFVDRSVIEQHEGEEG